MHACRSTLEDPTDFAFNALRSFGVVSDYRGLARVAGAVLGWSQISRDAAEFFGEHGQAPGCVGGVPDPEAEITAKLAALRAAIQADLQGFALLPNPRDSLFVADRITPLIDLIAMLQLVNYDQAAGILLDLVPPQIDRMRVSGYGQCRLNNSQDIQGRLMRSESSGGVFTAVSSFDVAQLEADIELCGMTIGWRLLDSTGTGVAGGTLGGGASPGIVLPVGSGSLTGPGNLELSGFLHALMCPSPASANAEQLEVAAGPSTQSLTRTAILTPSNQNDYLAVSPLLIPVAALRSAIGAAADATATAKVVIRRIGGLCAGLFANLDHSALGTLTVTLIPAPACPSPGASNGMASVCAPPPPPLVIDPGTPPSGTVGTAYSHGLQATGGVGDYQWSVIAGALPPGLSLAAGTGVIGGSPTLEGTFGFTVRVASGNQTDTRALAIVIAPPVVTGKYSGTFLDPANNKGNGTSFPISYWLVRSGSQYYLYASNGNSPPAFVGQQCRSELCTQLFDLSGSTFSFTYFHPTLGTPTLTFAGTVGGGVMHVDMVLADCLAQGQPCFYTFDGVLTIPLPVPSAPPRAP